MKQALSVIIVLLIMGLFIGGTSDYEHRIIKEIRGCGHFVLFLLFSFFLFTYSKLNRIAEMKRSAIILGVLLLFGLLTEAIQLGVGRDFDLGDLLHNELGALTGLFVPHLRFKTHLIRSILLTLISILLALFSMRSLLFVVVDEAQLRQDFPILSDFETPLQIGRWEYNLATLSMSDTMVKSGSSTMRVDLSPGVYPSITLKHMVGNWQDYEFIRFSVCLDAEHPIDFEVKVHDRQHLDSGYDYNDRFNSDLLLNPGWNDCSFSLHSIKSAPKNRSMNMDNIVSFSLFTIDLNQKITIYIDDLRLVKKSSRGAQ